MADRDSIPIDVRRHVLHVAGYMCANPICRTILTLDIHHMEQVSEGGGNDRENLVAICPNCHALHHRERGGIPKESIRAWHQLLLALNEAYPRPTVDLLLMLRRIGKLRCSGDGVLVAASGIAAGLVRATRERKDSMDISFEYELSLEEKGRQFVEGWVSGNQAQALQATAFGAVSVSGEVSAGKV